MDTQHELNYQGTNLDWLILDFTSIDGDCTAEITEGGATVAYRGGFETMQQARHWIDEYFLAMQ